MGWNRKRASLYNTDQPCPRQPKISDPVLDGKDAWMRLLFGMHVCFPYEIAQRLVNGKVFLFFP